MDLRSEFINAVTVKATVWRDVISCSLVDRYVCFGGTCRLHLLKMEALCSSRMFVTSRLLSVTKYKAANLRTNYIFIYETIYKTWNIVVQFHSIFWVFRFQVAVHISLILTADHRSFPRFLQTDAEMIP
jgi:hypothetical protein